MVLCHACIDEAANTPGEDSQHLHFHARNRSHNLDRNASVRSEAETNVLQAILHKRSAKPPIKEVTLERCLSLAILWGDIFTICLATHRRSPTTEIMRYNLTQEPTGRRVYFKLSGSGSFIAFPTKELVLHSTGTCLRLEKKKRNLIVQSKAFNRSINRFIAIHPAPGIQQFDNWRRTPNGRHWWRHSFMSVHGRACPVTKTHLNLDRKQGNLSSQCDLLHTVCNLARYRLTGQEINRRSLL